MFHHHSRRSVAGFYDDDATPDENAENRTRIRNNLFDKWAAVTQTFMIRFRAQWLEYPPSSILVQPDLRPILDDYDIYFHDFYV